MEADPPTLSNQQIKEWPNRGNLVRPFLFIGAEYVYTSTGIYLFCVSCDTGCLLCPLSVLVEFTSNALVSATC